MTSEPDAALQRQSHSDPARSWREHGGFPDLSRLKQLVRDRVAPDRSLGHSDRR